MTDIKPMRGKDPECLLYDCPHKAELTKALDELDASERKNQELNSRIETIDNIISQGLTDFKGLLAEIVKDKFKPEEINNIVTQIKKTFDTQKITDIINENLNLRKTINAMELRITEVQNENILLAQQKNALDITIKAREEKDLNLIKQIRNASKQAEDQLKILTENERKIKNQEMHLKMLEDFITQARSTINIIKEEHQGLMQENINLKEENKFINLNKLNLTSKGKKVMRIIKVIKSLKNNSINPLNYILRRDINKEYAKLKNNYFDLTQAERIALSNEYDQIARMMGE